MNQITIVGADTLLGQHLIKAFDNTFPLVKKKTWNYLDKLQGLDETLQGSDIVFNLHEAQDFSVVPYKANLEEHNVNFVRHLLTLCEVARCRQIVHISTVFLQCSSKWPNVCGREAEDFDVYRPECPFPEYCESKYRAERIVRNSDQVRTIIARIGPLYGEGDLQSVICDSIVANKFFGSIPLIGDRKGVMQLTYAGNVAYALIKASEKFLVETDVHHFTETVIVCDDTPIKDIYGMVEALLGSTVEGERTDGNAPQDKHDISSTSAEKGEETNVRLSSHRVPFYLFYPFYWLLTMFAMLFTFFRKDNILRKMPSPMFFYIFLYHWTFFANYKLRLYIDYKPKFDWPTSFQLSREYYSNLKPDQVRELSWLPSSKQDC